MSNTNYDDKKQQPLSVTDKSVRESTDSNIRYAGYASRFKVSSSRLHLPDKKCLFCFVMR